MFDIVFENIDIKSDVKRLIEMTFKEKTLYISYTNYTLFNYIDEFCFKYWHNRDHCSNASDYLETLGFVQLQKDAICNINALMTLIELIYNFWNLSSKDFSKEGSDLKWQGNYYHIKYVMNDILEQYNQKIYYDKKNERLLIIEDKQEVTAVAEIINKNLALDIIRYNHRSLQREIEPKKAILLRLGGDLEPKRKDIKAVDTILEDNIFYMLNNLNIRHNNKKEGDKYFKKVVSKMKKNTLEKWYDELYQLILLAYLLLDNKERGEKIKELKLKIENGGMQ